MAKDANTEHVAAPEEDVLHITALNNCQRHLSFISRWQDRVSCVLCAFICPVVLTGVDDDLHNFTDIATHSSQEVAVSLLLHCCIS